MGSMKTGNDREWHALPEVNLSFGLRYTRALLPSFRREYIDFSHDGKPLGTFGTGDPGYLYYKGLTRGREDGHVMSLEPVHKTEQPLNPDSIKVQVGSERWVVREYDPEFRYLKGLLECVSKVRNSANPSSGT